MQVLEINGGRRLFGEITVSGSKNAALPILFATVITHGVSVIDNVPDIADVNDCIEIIESFGAVVTRCNDRLTVDTENLTYHTPPSGAVCRIRASTYLIGACLSRFDKAEIMPFGGCNFSHRPIDLHLWLAELFGAARMKDTLVCSGLRPAHAVLGKVSVGATVNALLLAAGVRGESKITPYAREPHILSLIDFLRSTGAEIDIGEDTLTVRGGRLRGGRAVIVGDMVEAGSYLAAGIVTGGSVSVSGVDAEQLSSFLSPLSEGGVDISLHGGKITASGFPELPINIVTGPYPEFPTDLQPIVAPILALGAGGTICDRVWPSRFGYLKALGGFGLEYQLCSGLAKIKKSAFSFADATAPDLRGGAALMLAALASEGVSRIYGMEIIRRGYSGIAEKLFALGAEIKEIQFLKRK